MKLKLNRNILLIGIIGGILFFCMLNSCSFKEGMKSKNKKDGSIMNKVGILVKKVGNIATSKATGAAVGAINGTARAVGKSVNVVAGAAKILKKEALGNK